MEEINKELYNVIINYKVKMPSRSSDYDYDPSRPNRRFISTYIHELKILDKITDIELLNINFSSEVCSKLVIGIYSMLIANKKVITIGSVFSNSDPSEGNITISSIDNNSDMYCISYIQSNSTSDTSIYLHREELRELSDILDTKKLYEMYIGEE